MTSIDKIDIPQDGDDGTGDTDSSNSGDDGGDDTRISSPNYTSGGDGSGGSDDASDSGGSDGSGGSGSDDYDRNDPSTDGSTTRADAVSSADDSETDSGSGSDPDSQTNEDIIDTIRNGMGGHGAGGVGNPGGVGTGGPTSDSSEASGPSYWRDDGSGGSDDAGGGQSSGGSTGDQVDLNDDRRETILDQYVDDNADLVDSAPNNDVDGGPFTRDDLVIRSADNGGYTVGPSRAARRRVQSERAVDQFIDENSDLIDEGSGDTDGGRFSPDDITVTEMWDGQLRVGPSEQAIDRERQELRDEQVASWIDQNPGLVDTGPGDADGGRFEPDDIVVRESDDGDMVVGPSEAAIEREREEQASLINRIQRNEDDTPEILSVIDDAESDGRPEDPSRDGSTARTAAAEAAARDDEQFGDIDWSFGLGDPDEDEVENAIDNTTGALADELEQRGESFEQRADERAAEADELTGGYSPPGTLGTAGRSRAGGEFGEAAYRGAAGVAQLPSLSLEAQEAAVWATEGALRGPDEVQKRAEQAAAAGGTAVDAGVEFAMENPRDALSGVLVGAAAGGITQSGRLGRLFRGFEQRRVPDSEFDDLETSTGTGREIDYDDLPDTISGTDPDVEDPTGQSFRPEFDQEPDIDPADAYQRRRDRYRDPNDAAAPDDYDPGAASTRRVLDRREQRRAVPDDDLRRVVGLEDTLRGVDDVATGAADVAGYGPLGGGLLGGVSSFSGEETDTGLDDDVSIRSDVAVDTQADVDDELDTIGASDWGNTDVGPALRPGNETRTPTDVGQSTDTATDQPFDWGLGFDSTTSTRPTPDPNPDRPWSPDPDGDRPPRRPDFDLNFGGNDDGDDLLDAFAEEDETWSTGVAQSLDDALGGNDDGRDPFASF